MLHGWIKLTGAQAAALDFISDTNTGENFVAPVADVAGDLWLCADCLDEIHGLFARYASVLATLSVTQATAPIWPTD